MNMMPSAACFDREMVVDLFAGGGGTSTGIKMALGYPPDFAFNHDPVALAVHMVNHPSTHHGCKDIRGLDPMTAVPPGPIGLLWMSPDCRHFSKAKGGAPVSRSVRDLAWVGVEWAERRRPRVIMLENVEEFVTWCPLRADGKPDASRLGETFRGFVAALRALGYVVEWRVSPACDYGAFTIRKRLCLIARRDGRPIVWPTATHGHRTSPAVQSGQLKPFRIAADCIDWTLPCPSIFMTPAECEEWYRLTGQRVRRPLADNTMARIAAGLKRFVLDEASPFLVSVGYGEREGQNPRVHDLRNPFTTMVTGNKHALVTAFVSYAQQGGGSRPLSVPLHTLCASSKDQNQVVAAHLLNLKGSGPRGLRSAEDPMAAICAGGQHVAAVQAFMVKYYGTAIGFGLDGPFHTDTVKPRFGLVMVKGEPHQIVDIGMRMLTPRERFNAQGFPSDYKIDPIYKGRPVTAVAQGKLCGNSVEAHWAAAHVAANYQPEDYRVAA